MTLILAPDLPVCAVGDENRLMQTILNVAGNAVKFTKQGYISIIASVAKPESSRDWQPPEFYPASTDGHFYLRVQVLCDLSLFGFSLYAEVETSLSTSDIDAT